MVSNDTVEAVTAIRDGKWPPSKSKQWPSANKVLAEAWLDLWAHVSTTGKSAKADRRPTVEGVK
jgi:hypothetical protein